MAQRPRPAASAARVSQRVLGRGVAGSGVGGGTFGEGRRFRMGWREVVVGVGVGVLFKKKYKFENMKWLGLSWDVTAKNLET